MIGPCTSRATALTLSQSPREAAGKPASMTSTPSSASARATRSFSGCVMLQPGACSPSRKVVSKIRTRSGLGSCMSPLGCGFSFSQGMRARSFAPTVSIWRSHVLA